MTKEVTVVKPTIEVARIPISEHVKIDLNLLVRVMKVQTASRHQEMMAMFITRFLDEHDIPYYVDQGNIYATKGEAEIFPCTISHMDTVHSIVKNFGVYRNEDFLFSMNNDTLTQVGIGGDDKVGVYISLELLRYYPNMKAVFFRDEEIGLIGSGLLDKKFFNNVGYAIQNDRRGNNDFIYDIFGSIASSEYLDTIKDAREKYGYKLEEGASTDVLNVSEKMNISCTNLSCGYFQPHTDHEFISISDVEHTLNFNIELINTLGQKKYELEPNARNKKSNSYGYGYGYGYEYNNYNYNEGKSKSYYAGNTRSKSDYDNFYPATDGTTKPHKQRIEGAVEITVAEVYESVDIENSKFLVACKTCKEDIKIDLFQEFDVPIVCALCNTVHEIVDEYTKVDK